MSGLRKYCLVCDKDIPKNRKNYCSDRCRKRACKILIGINYEKNKEYFDNLAREKPSRIRSAISYNQPNKNKIREKIVSIVKDYQVKSILTLEGEEFLFSRSLPEKKIYVYEWNREVFDLMSSNKPSNVSLLFGNVKDFSEMDIKVDFVYLDFTQTYSTTKEVIFKLKEKILSSKLFAVTFCSRNNKNRSNEGGNYDLYLVKELQNLLGANFRVVYGESYREKRKTPPMITIVLENVGGLDD